ncbi:hypothetical protein C3747_33g80 [Trypanosoma cruzi]|uniref:Mitochondrial fission 1 protein n=3 Tax=Trypanosoma cruzi TaxID=5693 RepID=Q4CWH6_TRYCC|nr:hypothetical protein, conserved [Trypanosoma cruzi]EAN84634.1 hypothetical protein, conserved [Trypanosoma cruzi]KAF8291483.1 putative Fis1 C-terminal tetratricopeptide repeat [Trypanosoma cruzi]PWV14891.1 hypothetical protein C3747_33g80 [Trypanosoma cruzi]RNC60767.1 hypothetical protein TcCL_ESM01592 [Trypanosoma cruzi]|eukprot:XP_806485.1 hypothetical protein [Trypanosoma cruzi strain CL Brener]
MERTSSIINDLFKKDPNVRHILSPSQQELMGLDDAIRRIRAEYENNFTNSDIAFQYACLLILHSRSSYIEEGVRLMESLLYTAWKERQVELAGASSVKTNLMPGEEVDSQEDILRGSVIHAASAPPETQGEWEHFEHDAGEQEKETDTKSKRTTSTDELVINYYYLTIGWIKLRNYDKALICVNQMLQLQSDHRQGIALKQYIDAEVNMTLTATGLAGVGVAAAVAALIAVCFRKS